MSATNLTAAAWALLVSLLLNAPAFAQTPKIRIAATSATSIEKVALALAKDAGVLKKNNLELKLILITGGPAARINALLAGRIDATSLIAGVSHVAKQAGMNPMLGFAAKEIDYQMTGIVAGGDYLKSNAEAL